MISTLKEISVMSYIWIWNPQIVSSWISVLFLRCLNVLGLNFVLDEWLVIMTLSTDHAILELILLD